MSNLISSVTAPASTAERVSDVLAVTSALVSGVIVLLAFAAAF